MSEPVVIAGYPTREPIAPDPPTEKQRLEADLARIDAAAREWTLHMNHAAAMRRELGRMRTEALARLQEIDNGA